jgi:hypothetical protein
VVPAIFQTKIRWRFGRKTRSRRKRRARRRRRRRRARRRRRRRARRRRGGLSWGPGPVYGGVSLTDQSVPGLCGQLCNQMSLIKTAVHRILLVLFFS